MRSLPVQTGRIRPELEIFNNTEKLFPRYIEYPEIISNNKLGYWIIVWYHNRAI
jgi:hypothetical protein